MATVLSPYNFNLQGGHPQGTDPETYGTVEPAPVGFYVSNTIGSDSNDGLSPSTPFLTILKATQVASTPGDIVSIMAGTYTAGSGFFEFSLEGLLAIQHSGTLAEPIIFRAHLGDEGNVTLDGQGTKTGVLFENKDYVTIRNLRIINCDTLGISNPIYENLNSPYFSSITSANYSQGAVIEGCYITEVDGTAGSNIAGIRMNNSVDLTVKNTRIDKIRQDGVIVMGDHTAAVQAYHVKNALIKNNHFSNVAAGVLWKDHWLEDNDDALFESEISYNLFEGTTTALTLITGNTEPSGSNYVHHNIFVYDSSAVGISSKSSPETMPGGYLNFENNTVFITGASPSDTKAITVDVGTNLDINGNIIIGYDHTCLQTADTDPARADMMKITSSDYNVTDDSLFRITLSDGGVDVLGVNSLVDWQAMVAADHLSLSVDNPGTNSIESNSAALFTNAGAGDYTNKVGPPASPAIGLLLDGSNAGAYQLGTEVIGTTGGGAF